MRALSGVFVPILLALYWKNGATGNPVKTGESSALTLRIIHTNDMHARFEETSALSSKCLPEDAVAKKCYGGFARIATLVRQAKNSTTPTIFLNAGDTYQGSELFAIHKWKIVSKFLDMLSPDAISLGNHEFDDGPAGLVPFLQKATYPVVTANLDLSEEPKLAATKLQNSTIIVVNGTKIGITGYLTPDTSSKSFTGKVKFLDEVESLRREVAALTAKGVKILIALGHSGFEMDKKIAAEVDGIDLVIGGHTHTFLNSGKRPDLEVPEGLYPTAVTQKNGRIVYVVQAHAYTKYLGNLTIGFDANGEITKIFGNPVLVDSSVEQAKDILEELEKWRPEIIKMQEDIVGSTKVRLDGTTRSCRKKECNLGNLITDAMVDYHARQYSNPNAWTDAAIAIYNSGSIRASIAKSNDEKIKKSDVLLVLPYNNVQKKVFMKGSTFRVALEWSVHLLDPTKAHFDGVFLQLSGVQVTYDLSRPPHSRVSSVKVRCANCDIPSYAELNNDATYAILMLDFLHNGGDGYSMLKDLEATSDDTSISNALIDYLKKGPVHPDVEGRIGFVNKLSDGTVYRSPEPVANL